MGKDIAFCNTKLSERVSNRLILLSVKKLANPYFLQVRQANFKEKQRINSNQNGKNFSNTKRVTR